MLWDRWNAHPHQPQLKEEGIPRQTESCAQQLRARLLGFKSQLYHSQLCALGVLLNLVVPHL